MPPNPERQARLAARREQMANDPVLKDAQESANAAVLDRSRTPEVEAVKPRQMLPNYYAEGGKVGGPEATERRGMAPDVEAIPRPRDMPPTRSEVREPSKDEMNDARRRMGFQPRYNKGGMVKAGSPKITAPCKDTKTLKCIT